MRLFISGLLLLPCVALLRPAPGHAADLGTCVYNAYGGAIAYVEYTYKLKDGGRDTTKGSGFVIAGDGHILTNNHVLRPTSSADKGKLIEQEQVVVRLGGLGGEEHPASIVRRDETLDVALLKIEARAQPWPVAPLGDSGRLRPGAPITSLGFPGSDLTIVPTGQITAANAVVRGVSKPLWWQTSLAFNPGNSGGPVFDSSGTAIGIAVAIRDDAQQISYVIPMQYALSLAEMGGARPVPAELCASSLSTPDGQGASGTAGGPTPQAPLVGTQTVIGGKGGVAGGVFQGGTFNMGVHPHPQPEP